MEKQSKKEVTSQMFVWHHKSASEVLGQPFCKGHKKLHNFGVYFCVSLQDY
jgi:hypothetical protein